MPTIAMTKEDADYAVSFVAPADAEGIFYICGRQSCDNPQARRRKHRRRQQKIRRPRSADGIRQPFHSLGECSYVRRVRVQRRTGGALRRLSSVKATAAAKSAWATFSSARRLWQPITTARTRPSHLKDKLIEMVHLNETLYACGIACSAEGSKTASGNYIIDLMLANVCKQNVTRFPYGNCTTGAGYMPAA